MVGKGRALYLPTYNTRNSVFSNMDQTYLTIIWIFVTILFIAFFEGIEIAFVSVNRLQIELRKKQGKTSGLIISRFMEEPSRFIGTCLLGVNFSMVIYALLFSNL